MLGRKVLSDKYVTKLYNIFEKRIGKSGKKEIVQFLIDFVRG